jgi:ABC-2 type transport system permease protein
MSIAVPTTQPRRELLLGELRKLPAFIRRDFLVALSYRMSFFSDALSLVSLTLVFYFVGLLVDPSKLPTYGGSQVSYIEFAAIGLALGVYTQFGLDRVASAIRSEQMMGTLESLLITPTAPSTIQVGSVAFSFLYLPVRTLLFLVALAVAFGLDFEAGGILPALAILLFYVPFIWGFGVIGAAVVLTFRRGGGLVALGAMALALVSGVYFPLDLLPDWIASISQYNPVALAISGMRDALLGGAGWSVIAPTIGLLAAMSFVSLILGLAVFRLALRRERRRGTLGLY